MADQYGRRSQGPRSGVKATVKWFNPAKGFGFVQISPDEPDVFVHASVMTRAGIPNLPNGCTIVCDIGEGERGEQVTAIQSVDLSTATPEPQGGGRGDRFGGDRPQGDRFGGDRDRGDRFGGERSWGDRPRGGGGGRDSRPGRDAGRDGGGEERELTGMVKFYDANKGYGFVVPDGGERDVFVPGRVLPKTGLQRLEPNQRVRLRYREGDKGPLATWVETI